VPMKGARSILLGKGILLSETLEIPETIKAAVEEAKSPAKFNVRDAFKQNKNAYPERTVTIFTDGKTAGELQEVTEEIAELEVDLAVAQEQNKGGITESPEVAEVEAKIAEAEARQKALIKTVAESAWKVRVRGVAPALWRSIDKNWRAKIQPDDKTNEDQVKEADIERYEKVSCDMVAHGVVSITNASGEVDDSGIDLEFAEELYNFLMQSEWVKIKEMVDELSFSNGLFNRVLEEDADFLSQH
jgi:hypothetical protein